MISRLISGSRRTFTSFTRAQFPYDNTYHHPDILPTYYQSRKKNAAQTDVMHHFDSSSSSLHASTLPLKSKIPPETLNENGRRVHPSGFVVPDSRSAPIPRDYQRDPKIQTATVVERVEDEAGLRSVTAAMRVRQGKVPVEVQIEGMSVHASGFIPPTPATSFPVRAPSEQENTDRTPTISNKSRPDSNPRSTETDPRQGISEDTLEKNQQRDDVIGSEKEELMSDLVNEISRNNFEASIDTREEKKMDEKAKIARPV